MAQKIFALLFGGFKITPYLCNCQTSCSNTQIRARRNSSPELIKFRWAYFYAHTCRLLQRRYGGCLPVN
uniref:Uncharacterized protein n=1 Tax=Siphoviridae sp. ctyU16 TaxID=2827976 RepID=A0A8S5TNX2_9CAUD|nr:MAG TPA: hypothetical protein [Siphoviridae sp. ctyU16]